MIFRDEGVEPATRCCTFARISDIMSAVLSETLTFIAATVVLIRGEVLKVIFIIQKYPVIRYTE